MKNKTIFHGSFCALFFLALLSDSFGQNPILRSTTTGVPSLSGVTSSLITENGNFIGIGTVSPPTKRFTIGGFAEFLPGGFTNAAPPVIRFEYNTFNLPVTTRNWELSANLNNFALRYDNAGIVPITVLNDGTVNLMDKMNLTVQPIAGNNTLGFVANSAKRQIFWTSYNSGTNNSNIPLEFMYDGIGSGVDVSVMTLMPTGKVGIGTTAPSEKLEVSGGNFKVNNGNATIINGTFTVSNGSNQFKVYSNGNVRAREVLIDLLTIPDYVFTDKYPLMSLEELRNYIQKNKHLPGIQSESEYKDQGHINVGELNVKLLEKVEELTLYILQLEEKMGKMNKEIEAINAQQK